jgi:hypothetical protein
MILDGISAKELSTEARKLKKDGFGSEDQATLCDFIKSKFLTANWMTIRDLLYAVSRFGSLEALDDLLPLADRDYDEKYAVLSELGRSAFDMLLRLGVVDAESHRLLNVMAPNKSATYEGIFWGMHEAKYKPSLWLQQEILKKMSTEGVIDFDHVAWFYACTWNWEVEGKNELMVRCKMRDNGDPTSQRAIECSIAGKYFKLN